MDIFFYVVSYLNKAFTMVHQNLCVMRDIDLLNHWNSLEIFRILLIHSDV